MMRGWDGTQKQKQNLTTTTHMLGEGVGGGAGIPVWYSHLAEACFSTANYFDFSKLLSNLFVKNVSELLSMEGKNLRGATLETVTTTATLYTFAQGN